jgi:hypothetical protein
MSGSWQEATAEVEARLDGLIAAVQIAAVQDGMPESWDGDAAAESLIVDYVREIERRLIALGGSLERVSEDEDGAPLPDAGESPQAYAAAVRQCPSCGTLPTPISLPAAERLERAYAAFGELTETGGPGTAAGVIAAIEVARTVEIDEVLAGIFEAAADTPTDGNDVPAGLRAVFARLGLKVSGS